MSNNDDIRNELRTLVVENNILTQRFDDRIKKYAKSVNQNWVDIKDYFVDNTDGEREIYFNAVDNFLSSEGF